MGRTSLDIFEDVFIGWPGWWGSAAVPWVSDVVQNALVGALFGTFWLSGCPRTDTSKTAFCFRFGDDVQLVCLGDRDTQVRVPVAPNLSVVRVFRKERAVSRLLGCGDWQQQIGSLCQRTGLRDQEV